MFHNLFRNRKKLLVALTLGAVVFSSVFAMAASITLTSNKLAAGNQTVAACDTAFSTSYTTAYDSTLAEYEVDQLTINDIADGCDGETVKAVFTNASNVVIGSEQSGTVPTGVGTSHALAFSTAQVPADDIAKVHVVISGA